jgi:hypothetical protein
MLELQHFDKGSSQTDIESAFLRDGGCINDNLISNELCDVLMADFMPHIDAALWNNASEIDSN